MTQKNLNNKIDWRSLTRETNDDKKPYKNKPEFHKLKPIIMKAQNNVCARCHTKLTGKQKARCELHHIDYSGGTENENNDETNLIYLCSECHDIIHVTVIQFGYVRHVPTHLEKLFFEAECQLLWNQIRGINPKCIKLNTIGEYSVIIDGDN